jgi:hypothetical protein
MAALQGVAAAASLSGSDGADDALPFHYNDDGDDDNNNGIQHAVKPVASERAAPVRNTGGGAGGGINERVASSWLTAGNDERADRSEPRLRRHMRTKQYRGMVYSLYCSQHSRMHHH